MNKRQEFLRVFLATFAILMGVVILIRALLTRPLFVLAAGAILAVIIIKRLNQKNQTNDDEDDSNIIDMDDIQ